MEEKTPVIDPIIAELIVALEEYFKPENIQKDFQLVNLLQKQQFLTIENISKFPLVSQLTSDRNVLIKALEQAQGLALDESKRFVIPDAKFTHRTTLILRDLPNDVTIDEVKRLLSNPECGRVKEIHPDVNKTWFVSFGNEEDCLNTARWIQNNGVYRGQKVRCCVKTEHRKTTFRHNAPKRTSPILRNSSKPKTRHNGFRDPAVLAYGPPGRRPVMTNEYNFGTRTPYDNDFFPDFGPPPGRVRSPMDPRMSPHNRHQMDFYNGPPGPMRIGPPHAVPHVRGRGRSPPYSSHSGPSSPYYQKKRRPENPRSRSPRRRNKRSPKTHQSRQNKSADYEGIFQLINKETIDLVLQRFIENNPDGTEKPAELEPHEIIAREEPMKTFALPSFTTSEDNQV